MMTSSSAASMPAEEAAHPPAVPHAPWMPLEPLTELWAAFGREATSAEAALAVSCAFAALADEQEAVHALNWLSPAWLPSAPRTGAAADPSVCSLLVGQEAIIAALSRAAAHWYEATRVLLEYADQPRVCESAEQGELSVLDLETLIGYTLSQRVRVWAIAHSLLAEQLQQLFPHQQHEMEANT